MVFVEQAFSAAESEIHIHTAAITEADLKAETYLIGFVQDVNVSVDASAEYVRKLGSRMPQDTKGGNISIDFSVGQGYVNETFAQYMKSDLSSGFGATFAADPTDLFITFVAVEGGTNSTGDDILYAALSPCHVTSWNASVAQGDTLALQSISGTAEDIWIQATEYA